MRSGCSDGPAGLSGWGCVQEHTGFLHMLVPCWICNGPKWTKLCRWGQCWHLLCIIWMQSVLYIQNTRIWKYILSSAVVSNIYWHLLMSFMTDYIRKESNWTQKQTSSNPKMTETGVMIQSNLNTDIIINNVLIVHPVVHPVVWATCLKSLI